jgi:hypothetical protein
MDSAAAPSGVKVHRTLLEPVVASIIMLSSSGTNLTPVANLPIQSRMELFQDFFTGQDCKIIWK